MSKHIQHDIDLVHAERWLPSFQFTDKTNPNPGAICKITLSHLVTFAVLSNKVCYGHLYTRSVIIMQIMTYFTPVR
jgi:hypothetical protein